MTYIFISSGADAKDLAHELKVLLEQEGYSAWESVEGSVILGDLETLGEDALALSAAVVIVGEKPDASQTALARQARALRKPTYHIGAPQAVPALLDQLRRELPQTTTNQPTLLPTPLEMREFHQLQRQTGRIIDISPVVIIMLVLAVAAGLIVGYPLIRSLIAADETVEPTATLSAVIIASETPTPVPPTNTYTAEPTDLPTATPTAAPTEIPTTEEVATLTATPTASPTPTNTTAPTRTRTPRPITLTFTSSPTSAYDSVPSADATPFPAGYSNLRWQPINRAHNGMNMVFVPAGCFLTGAEAAQTRVCVEAFWMGQAEVTTAQYAACVTAGACTPPVAPASRTQPDYYGNPEYADYPVINVTWTQANDFSQWFGGQLPTETQWRYAAQGPSNWRYPWGMEPPTGALLNYNGLVGDTSPVGDFERGSSWVGAYDLAGNVWEWTSTPTTTTEKVVCGGSWNSFAGLVRSDYHASNPQDEGNFYTGFRVMVPLQADTQDGS